MMVPANQRLNSSDRVTAHVNDWLIMDLKAAACQRIPKIAFERPAINCRL
jgi:hypothetical protein